MGRKKIIPEFYSYAVSKPEAKESPIDFLKRLKEAENQVIDKLLVALLKRKPTISLFSLPESISDRKSINNHDINKAHHKSSLVLSCRDS
jgi:hypothetical protein